MSRGSKNRTSIRNYKQCIVHKERQTGTFENNIFSPPSPKASPSALFQALFKPGSKSIAGNEVDDLDEHHESMAKEADGAEREADYNDSSSFSLSSEYSSATKIELQSENQQIFCSQERSEVLSELPSSSSSSYSSCASISATFSTQQNSDGGDDDDEKSHGTLNPLLLHKHEEVRVNSPLYMTVVWTEFEQKQLDTAINRYRAGTHTPLLTYLKIASTLPGKSVRDVALRIQYMKALHKQKKRKDRHASRQAAKSLRKIITTEGTGNKNAIHDQTDAREQGIIDDVNSIFPDPIQKYEHTKKSDLAETMRTANKLMADNECILQEIAFLQSKEDSLADIIELMSKFKGNIVDIDKLLSQICDIPMPPLPAIADFELPSHLAGTMRIHTSLI